jgi:histidinol-phosphatase (PHP family)
MEFNLHTHTKRCGHAIGEDEEYVLAAIEAGIKTLGFSDHAPFLFPSGKEQGHCVKTGEAEEYCESILSLKEKYKDKIDIHVGFEMEYYPTYFNEMLSYVKSIGAEYLILGQHAIYDGGFFVHGISDSEEKFKEYIRCTIEAMRTGAFTYLAHPDVVSFRGSPDDYEREMTRLMTEVTRLNIPIELNLLGLAEDRNYPTDAFWNIASKFSPRVILGCDAHDPASVADKGVILKALKFADNYSLNVIESLSLINPFPEIV